MLRELLSGLSVKGKAGVLEEPEDVLGVFSSVDCNTFTGVLIFFGTCSC